MDTNTTTAPGPAEMRQAIETHLAAAGALRSRHLGAILRGARAALLERARRARAVAPAHPLRA